MSLRPSILSPRKILRKQRLRFCCKLPNARAVRDLSLRMIKDQLSREDGRSQSQISKRKITRKMMAGKNPSMIQALLWLQWTKILKDLNLASTTQRTTDQILDPSSTRREEAKSSIESTRGSSVATRSQEMITAMAVNSSITKWNMMRSPRSRELKKLHQKKRGATATTLATSLLLAVSPCPATSLFMLTSQLLSQLKSRSLLPDNSNLQRT